MTESDDFNALAAHELRARRVFRTGSPGLANRESLLFILTEDGGLKVMTAGDSVEFGPGDRAICLAGSSA